jgi:hypothetical protein
MPDNTNDSDTGIWWIVGAVLLLILGCLVMM